MESSQEPHEGHVLMEPSVAADKLQQLSKAQKNTVSLISKPETPNHLTALAFFDHGHVAVILSDIREIFHAISVLRDWVGTLEASQKPPLLKFESFASFFSKLQSALEDAPKDPGNRRYLGNLRKSKHFEEAKANAKDWPAEFGRAGTRDIKKSQILIFLHFKTLQNLLVWGDLNPEQSRPMLDKLLQLAQTATTHENIKQVLKSISVSQELQGILEELDPSMMTATDLPKEFEKAIAKIQASFQPSPGIMETPTTKTDSINNSVPTMPTVVSQPAVNNVASVGVQRDSAVVQPDLDSSFELVPDSKEESKAVGQTSSGGQLAPTVYDPNLQATAQASLAMSSVTVRRHPASMESLHQWTNKKPVTEFPWKPFYSVTASSTGRFVDDIHWQTASKQLTEAQHTISWKSVADPTAVILTDSSVIKKLVVVKSHFSEYSFVQRLELIFKSLEGLKDKWTTKASKFTFYTCQKNPFTCICDFHKKYSKIFIYSSLALLSGVYVQFQKQWTLKELLADLDKCGQKAECWLIQRLLPLIAQHSDDLGDITDEYLQDLVVPKEYNRSAQWYFRAQIMIRKLKNGEYPRTEPGIRNLSIFLHLYVQNGEYFLRGETQRDYQAEFLACCKTLSQKNSVIGWDMICLNMLNKSCDYGVYSIPKAVFLWQTAVESEAPAQLYAVVPQELSRILIEENVSFMTFWQRRDRPCCERSKGLLNLMLTRCNFELKVVVNPNERRSLQFSLAVLEFCEKMSSELQISPEETQKRLWDTYSYLTRDIKAESLSTLRTELDRKADIIWFFSQAKLSSSWFAGKFNHQALEDHFASAAAEIKRLQELNARLNKLVALKQPYEIQSSDEIDAWRTLLVNEKALKVQDLRSYEVSVSKNFKHILTAYDLLDLPFYKALISKRSKDKPASFQAFEKRCCDAETEVRQLFQGSALDSMDETLLSRLDAFFKDSDTVKKISEAFKISDTVKTVRKNYRFIKLLKDFDAIKPGLEVILEKLTFVKDSGSDIKKMSELSKLYAKRSLGNSSITEAMQDRASIDRISTTLGRPENKLFALNLSNVCGLFEEFQSKNDTHFQNLLTCKAMRTADLNLNSIKELERFMKAFGSSDSEISLADFLESMTRPASSTDPSKFNIVEVVLRSQTLIRISKNISDNLERGSNQMNNILLNSIVLFSPVAHSRSISAVAKYQEEVGDKTTTKATAEQEVGEMTTRKATTEEVVTMEVMKSIQIQMALFESAKEAQSSNKEPIDSAQSKSEQSGVFIQLVDHIEAIQESLQGMVELGLVYDLATQIKTDVPELGELIAEHLLKSQNHNKEHLRASDYRQSLENLSFPELLSLQIPIKAKTESTPALPDISPFLVLRVLLKHQHTIQKQRLASPGLLFHPLTHLEGFQKVVICQWLQLQSNSQYGSDKEILTRLKQQVSSITKFAFAKDFTTQNLSHSDCAKLLVGSSGNTSQVLEAAYGRLFQTSVEASPETETTEDALADKSLFYFETKPSQAFSGLLQVLLCQQRTFGSTAQLALQFMLANPDTSAADLLLFLLRAAQDPEQRFYYMVDLHLVKLDVAYQFFSDLQAVFFTKGVPVRNKNLMLLLSSEAKHNELLVNFMRHPSFRSFRVDMPEVSSQKVDLEAARKVFPGLKLTIVDSEIAGMGKSVHIKRQVPSTGIHSIINLSGDFSREGIMKRLAIVQDSLQSHNGKLISLQFVLDMVENFEENCEIIDQFLFQLAFLKKVDYQDSIIGLAEISQMFLEIQNTCKSTYMARVSVLGLLAQGENRHRVQSVTDIGDLKRLVDFGKLSASEQSRAGALAYLMKNLDKFAKHHYQGSFTTEEDKAAKCISSFCDNSGAQAQKDIFLDGLVNLVNKKCGRRIENTTMSQIVSFINMAYFQVEEFCKVYALDLSIPGIDASSVVKLRLEVLNKLFTATVELLWQDSDSIRAETKNTQQLMRASDDDEAKNQLLEDYKLRMNKIRDWRDSKMVSYFILNGILKLIYCHLSDVPHNVRETLSGLDPSWTRRILEDEVIVPFDPSRPDRSLKSKRDNNTSTSFFVQLYEVLCPLISEDNKRMEISKFRNGFTFTQDIYVKILMIVQRACQRIPIVIMGPTGCGKTYLITFTAKCLLGDEFRQLTLHPGITEDRLKRVLFKIQQVALELPANKRLWVLFDEFNTSHLQSLVAEIISTRRAHFHNELKDLVFADNIIFVACCNPFKIEPAKYNQVGLLNQSKASLLSHRVYPIPDTLVPFVWRFSSIQNDDEKKHIQLKLDSVNIPPMWKVKTELHNSLKQTAEVCHRYHRENGSENSISLRDLTRFKDIYEFLMTHFYHFNWTLTQQTDPDPDADAEPFTEFDGLIVAAEFCYVLRLETHEQRDALRQLLSAIAGLKNIKSRFDAILDLLKEELGRLDNLKDLLQKAVLNRPLLENIFALWICIITRIPLLICGKPGTSKTLSISIINAAFANSHVSMSETKGLRFFNEKWSLTPANFWGTETTTADSVESAFDTAEQTYQNLTKTDANRTSGEGSGSSTTALKVSDTALFDEEEPDCPVRKQETAGEEKPSESTQDSAISQPPLTLHRVPLYFDEIGLAEISPDNPLKVLHPKLEPKTRTLSFVGISNWKLDASKQNRVLYLARPDMTIDDLVLTCSIRFQHYQGAKLVGSDATRMASRYSKFQKTLEPYFRALAEVYEQFRKQQESSKTGHANFHGSRDFYSVVGILEHSIRCLLDVWDDSDTLELPEKERCYLLMRNAIQRSFSGHDDSLPGYQNTILKLYEQKLDPKYQGCFTAGNLSTLKCMDLIYQNLLDNQARHLMIFTETSGIQEIILQNIRNFQTHVQGLSENKFVFLSQSKGRDEMIKVMMTQLPIYTREGFTVVMKDIQDVYGCMYDLLNKNYVKSDAKKMNQCKLFYENNHQLIDVDDNFKIILLMDRVDPNKDQKELEKLLPPPFLNRFEKYYIGNREFMTAAQQAQYLKLRDQCYPDKPTKFIPELNRLVFNLSDELLVSAVTDFQQMLTTRGNNKAGESEGTEGLWRQSVLNYLTGYASGAGSDSSNNNHTTSSHPSSKTQSASELALGRLFPLFNKNMILALFVCMNNKLPLGLNFEDIDEIRQKFLDSHPFDSLPELVAAMSNPRSTLNKVVVFTFSNRYEVDESLKELPKDSLRVDLRDAYNLHKQINLSQGEVVSQIVSDKGSVLLADFRDSESRKLMHHLRYWINKAPGSAEKKVIFTVHISSDDFVPGNQNQSPISYSTIGWTMHAIDDLRGSCYAEFFDLLQKPFTESFISENKAIFGKNSKPVLLKQIITEALRKLFFKMLSQESDTPDFAEFSSLIDTVSNREAIVTHFKAVLEKTVEESAETDEKEFSLTLKPPKNDAQGFFRSHHNMDSRVIEEFRGALSIELQVILQEQIRSDSLRGLHKILILPHEIQEKFLVRVDRLFTTPTKEQNSGLFDAAEALEFKGRIFEVKYKQTVEDLKTKVHDIYQGVAEATSLFEKKFVELLSSQDLKGCFSGDKPAPALEVAETMETEDSVPQVSSEAATEMNYFSGLLTFEKYELTQPTTFSKEVRSLIMLSAHEYLKKKAIPVDKTTISACMILISKVFAEELQALAICLSSQTNASVRTLIEQGAFSLATKGNFELDKYLVKLFRLEHLHNKAELFQLQTQIKAGITFCKRLPKLLAGGQKPGSKQNKHLLQHEFLYSVLGWMSTVEDETLCKSILNQFNVVQSQTDLHDPQGVTLMLLQFQKVLASEKSSEIEVFELIDISIHYCTQLFDQESSLECQKLFCQLVCLRILGTTTNSIKYKHCLVTLAKVLVRQLHFPDSSEQLRTLIETELKDCASEVSSELNFHMVTFTGEIPQDLRGKTLAQQFLDTDVTEFRRLIESQPSNQLLTGSQVTAIRHAKQLFTNWQEDAIHKRDNDALEKSILSELILRNLNSDKHSTDFQFGIIMCQMLHDVLRNLALKGIRTGIGLVNVEEKLESIMEDPNIEIIFPDSQKMKEVVRLSNFHKPAGMKSTFIQKLLCLPVISPSHTADKQRASVVQYLSGNPRFGLFVASLSQTDRKTELQLQDKKVYNLHLLVSMAALVAQEAPSSFVYSEAQLKLAMKPIINMEEPKVVSMLEALDDKLQNDLNWTKAWRCTSPGCDFISTLRNCGRWGYHMEDKTSFSKCPGPCQKDIGRYAQNGQGNDFVELPFEDMKKERDALLKEDTVHMKIETYDPESYFHESAYRAKYAQQFPHGDDCRLAYTIQHCFALAQKIYDANLPEIQLPMDNNLMQLLSRDIEFVAAKLRRDLDTTILYFMVLFEKMLTDMKSKPENYDDYQKFRMRITEKGRSTESEFPTIVNRYHELKAQICDQSAKEKLILQNFIARNFSVHMPNKGFPNLQQLSLWTVPTIRMDRTSINDYLDAHAADSDAARFIAKLNLQGELGMLQSIRPVLSAIRDLSNLITKNFSTWFSQDKAVRTNILGGKPKQADSTSTTAEPTMDESRPEAPADQASPYLLTLQSVIDNSYFKNLETQEQPTPKPKTSTKKQSILKTIANKKPAKQEDQVGLELGKEFHERFSKVFSKHMQEFLKDGSSKNENFQSKLKVGCEQAGVLLQLIRNLTNANLSPLIAYIVPNFSADPNADPHLNIMKSLIEAFVEVQEELIKNHRDWVPFLPKLGNATKPFSECSDENFMHFDDTACKKDLEDAAYLSLDPDTNRTELVIDLDLVAQKWAGALFSEAQRITVVPNFKFLDQLPENLLSICQKLRGVHELELTTDLSLVAYLDPHIRDSEDVLELDQMLVLVLNHALTSFKAFTAADVLDSLTRVDMKKLLPDGVLKGLSLGHLEAVRRKLLLSTFDSVYEDLKTNEIFKSMAQDKTILVPQDKPAMQELLRTRDLRERSKLLQTCIDEVRTVCATFINYTNINDDVKVSYLVTVPVVDQVEEVDAPEVLTELNRLFKIEPETTLVSLYKLVDKLKQQESGTRTSAAEDEDED